MSAVALVAGLLARNIKLHLEDGKLKIHAPKGVVTPELTAQIKSEKDAIIALLRDAMGADRGDIPLRDKNEPAPASFAQQRLWFIDQLEGASATYNIPLALRLRGSVDVAALRASIQGIVDRHETLRTTFATRNGEPVQVIAERLPVEVALLSITEARLAERVEAFVEAPFDLAEGPLLRAMVLRLAPDDHVLLTCMHHIISDGWSVGVLVAEFGALYSAGVTGASAELPPLPIQYADFAQWQRDTLQGDALQRQQDYWRAKLADLPPLLELPIDRPRPPVQGFAGATHSFVLPRALRQGLKAIAQAHGATLFMVLLTAFKALLARYSGQVDIAVGTPIANRTRPELEGLIGFFVNTLVLRDILDPQQSFDELLAQVRTTALGAYENQDLPFEQLVELLHPVRSMSHSPLFQVMFSMQNTPEAKGRLPGLELAPLSGELAIAKFDLQMTVQESDEDLFGSFSYRTDLFDAVTVARLADHYIRLVAAMVSNPRQAWLTADLLSPAERRQRLAEWNDTAASYPAAGWVHQEVEAQAAAAPQQAAVLFEGESIDYATLNVRANRLAHYLRAEGVGPDVIVGVCLERSVELVVTLLAIMKSGGAYVPVAPDYPHERIRYLLDDARPRLLLTASDIGAQLPSMGVPILCVDRDQALWSDLPAANPDILIRGGDLAYVLYTSGSTGRPKGTMNTHAALRNRLCSMQAVYPLQASERILQKAPYSFDVSVREFFWPLMTGAAVVLARPDGHRDPGYLLELIARQNVSTVHFVPSMMQVFLNEPGLERLPHLRMVFCGGEALTPALAQRFLERLPDAALYNLYGPTEAAIDVSDWHCTHDSIEPAVPIGLPIANTRLYVLDSSMQLVPVGVAGELHIGGVSLARGYLGRADLTAEKFVPDPFDGEGGRLYRTGDRVRQRADGAIEYLERLDHQVKIRGFRIELGEVEAAITDLSGVREAAVLASADERGDTRLVAYVVATGLDAGQLRAALRARLPEHMVPTQLMLLDALPVTANGKLDRKALPAMDPGDRTQAPYVAPGSPTEQRVADAFMDVLKHGRPVGIHDNFFEIGGHSLLATQVVSRMRQAFDVAMPVRQLFDSPTVAELALWVDAQGRQSAGPALVAVPRTAPLPLSFAQQRLWFIDQLEGAHAAYNMPAALRLSGTLDVAALRASIQAIVDRHETLRTCFATVAGEPVQQIAAQRTIEVPLVEVEEAALMARAQAFAEAPFDLARGPLLRAELLRLGPGEHVLLTNMHHIISDGWSVGVLVGEFVALYRARVEGAVAALPALPVQYADFAQWQRQCLQGEMLQRQQDYWKTQLAELPPLLTLPTDRPRPAVQGMAGGSHAFVLPAALTQALKALGQARGATLFMTLLAAFKVLLARYAGQADIAVGTPIANRTRPELEGLIGFFVNTLVLRTQVRPEQSFETLLDEVRTTALAAYEHQDLPFEQLVELLQPARSLSHSPLFQVMFSMQNTPAADAELPGLVLRPLESELTVAKFDLNLSLSEDDGRIGGSIEYSTHLFDGATIERLAGHYVALLGAIAAQPEQPIAKLSMLRRGEHETLLQGWRTPPASPAEPCCLHQRIERRALAMPNATAVVCEGVTCSYGELNARANQLAHHLIACGVGPDVVVGVCLERSIELVVSLLAILKAGGAYLPLDPAGPPERARYVLNDASVHVLLAQPEAAPLFENHVERLIPLDGDDGAWCHQPGANPVTAVTPRHLAYAIYTSGSTGTPKGVMVEHANADRFLAGFASVAPALSGGANTIVGAFGFDVSVWELFDALCFGAAAHVLSREWLLEPDRLAGYWFDHDITTAYVPPALLEPLLAALDRDARPMPLRRLLVGVEPIDASLLKRYLARCPDLVIVNGYGPTEGTICSTLYRFDESSAGVGQVPIGRALPGYASYLLDADLQPMPVGVVGELFVGGAGVARGYLGDPAKTAASFLPDPFSTQAGARCYRTGDLARQRADGELAFVGRRDAQVKVRGFRIELREIDLALAASSEVGECVTMAVESAAGKRLVSYVAAARDAHPTTASVLAHLRGRLPDYMLPTAVVFLEAMPMTANGKLDRRSLPAPESIEPADKTTMAARTETERNLVMLWSDVLQHRAPVGIHDNFFEIGGHSLLATQVVSRMRQAFDVAMPVRQLFDSPTVAELALWVEAQGRQSAGPALVAVPRTAPLPLSFAQQRLWFIDQLEGAHAAYNMPAALRLSGTLDVAALRASIQAIVDRHETLRTCFATVAGEPVQQIAAQRTIEVPLVEVEEAALMARAQAFAEAPFDLARGPLLRAELLRLGPGEHVLLTNMHHIISDGWSVGVLVGEFVALYRARVEGAVAALPALPVQYADFAQWQRQCLQGETLQRQQDYWKTQLAELPPLLTLPTDRPRPAVQGMAGGSHAFVLPAALTQALKALGQARGATLFMTLLAAFKVLLARYAGQADIAVGTPIANRTRPELEGLIGFFVNTLVLRTQVRPEQSFETLLDEVRTTALAAYEHQDLPFEQLVELLQPARSLSQSPLFQVMFSMQNTPAADAEMPGLALRPLESELTMAKFDLQLDMQESDGHLVGSLTYRTELFEAATITRLGAHFEHLLAAIVHQPQERCDAFELLSATERRRVLEAWNAGAVAPPGSGWTHEVIAARAAATPQAPALVFEGRTIDYATLNTRANRLAHYLRAQGVGPDVIVGVCLERSIDLVVSLLAILKAGGAYLPLATDDPAERRQYLLQDAQPRLLLTRRDLREQFPRTTVPVLCVEETARWHEQPGHDPAVTLHGEHLAYVIYTSGSTGQPKGTLNTHGGLRNRLHCMQVDHGLQPGERFLQKTPYNFDVSVREFFWPLMVGATLVVARPDGHRDPGYLRQLIASARVNAVHFVPSMLQVFLGEPGLSSLHGLRQVLCSGEALPPALAQRCLAQLPQAELHNMYGPTEAAIEVSTWQCTTDNVGQGVPIGHPLAANRLYVLDARMQPVPLGVAGELYIGGVQLARGYLGRAGLTAQAFVPDPFGPAGGRLYRTGDRVRQRADGAIEYLERLDHQVKLRGFRIELGEVEAAIAALAGVREAAVLAVADGSGDMQLVAYVVASAARETVQLRAELQRRLPGYMVPAQLIRLEALPVTANGKLDRKALPTVAQVDGPQLDYVAPRNATEQGLAEIWAEVLSRVAPIGIHDNFFEIGGHSLRVLQLMVRIRERLGVDLPLRRIFALPTIAAMAADLAAETPPWDALVRIQPGRADTVPLFLVHPIEGSVYFAAALARGLGPEQPVYGVQAYGLEAGQEPLRDIDAMASQYVSAIRQVQAHGPYRLAGYSFGGVVAVAMARQLREAGVEVAFLGLLDAHPTLRAAGEGSAALLAGLWGPTLGFAEADLLPLDEAARLAFVLERAHAAGVVPAAYGHDDARRQLRVLEAHFEASAKHTPAAYRGTATLFAARDNRPPVTAADWHGRIEGALEVVAVPGDHLGIMTSPHVEVLASLLQERLPHPSVPQVAATEAAAAAPA